MRTLAVKQPFATFIAEGSKLVELRTWATKYRGPLLIAASGRPMQVTNDDGLAELLPAQCLVCVVDLVDVFSVTPENLKQVEFMAGGGAIPGKHMAWQLENPRMVHPSPHKGKLQLYETPESEVRFLPGGLHFLDCV